jgi:hypothetical protein
MVLSLQKAGGRGQFLRRKLLLHHINTTAAASV